MILLKKIKCVFNDLCNNSNILLQFIEKDVSNDYTLLIKVSEDFNNSAINSLNSWSDVKMLMDDISSNIVSVGEAMGSLSEVSNASSNNTSGIIDTIDGHGERIENMTKDIANQHNVFEELSYKIKNIKF